MPYKKLKPEELKAIINNVGIIRWKKPYFIVKKRKLYRLPRQERIKSYMKKWKLNNKEKVKAHSIVFIAIRNGKLIKQPCFCKNIKSEAHHEDYSKPLEVIWLCKKHHSIEDKRLRNRARL